MTNETTAPVQSLVDEVLAELDQLAAFHRELNPSDYDLDDVCSLNDWGVEAFLVLEKAAGLIRQQQALIAKPATPVAVPTPPAQQSQWVPDEVREAIEAAFEDRPGWPLKIAKAVRVIGDPVSAQQSQAAIDVLAERRRQTEVEGWTPAHDDEHSDGQMAVAAGYYALACGWPHERDMGLGAKPTYWPWDAKWWKPKDSRSNLIKAGALILAEIERLDRAAAPGGTAAPEQDKRPGVVKVPRALLGGDA